MKQYGKRIAAMIAALCLCLCLCSCDFYGAGKAAIAHYQNEDKTELLFEEATYRLIEVDASDVDIYGSPVDTEFYGYAIEKDASPMFALLTGDVFGMNTDKTVIWFAQAEETDSDVYEGLLDVPSEYRFYVRADVYDTVVDAMKEESLTQGYVLVEWWDDREAYFSGAYDELSDEEFDELTYQYEYRALDRSVMDTLSYLVTSQPSLGEEEIDFNTCSNAFILVGVGDETPWVVKTTYTIYCGYNTYIEAENNFETRYFPVPEAYKDAIDRLYDIAINGSLPTAV